MKRRLIALLLSLALVFILTGCGLEVPRPEIKEGRFDLSITYELCGEVKMLSTVYVCEFGGTSLAIDSGYASRDWDSRMEGDYEGDDNSAIIARTDDGGEIIIFFGVYPEYFMGDPETGDMGIPEPELFVSYASEDGDDFSYITDTRELEETYGVKIISYDYAEPIENSFSLFDF